MRALVLVVGAFAFCKEDYTCCCQYDLFIPVMCECVQDEPGLPVVRANNCKRDDRSKPGPLEPAVSGDAKKAFLHGLCLADAKEVSRADLEAREAKEAVWQKHFVDSCTNNGAHCTTLETCWYDGRLQKGEVTEQREMPAGAQCVCDFPNARDASGKCVDTCKDHFVQRPDGPGAQTFGPLGEFHCATSTDKLLNEHDHSEAELVKVTPAAVMLAATTQSDPLDPPVKGMCDGHGIGSLLCKAIICLQGATNGNYCGSASSEIVTNPVQAALIV